MTPNRATLFGVANSPEAYELRDFLKRSGFRFEWIDLKTDEEARTLAGVSGLNDPRLPICVMEKGSVLVRPTIPDLAAALDWFRGPKHERYDLAIYGAGPAGLSAAVYGASEGLRTIVLERSAVGGQSPGLAGVGPVVVWPVRRALTKWRRPARRRSRRLGRDLAYGAGCWRGTWFGGRTQFRRCRGRLRLHRGGRDGRQVPLAVLLSRRGSSGA